MFSSLSSVLLRLGAWSYIPDFATKKLLFAYYRVLSSRGGTPAPFGSPLWQAHYRIAYSISVVAYLLYNLIEAARCPPPNFYQILGVTPDVDEMALRSAYRTFAKLYHPDRAGPASESLFIAVQNAYEALKNPTKRFAYERFGPEALSWRNSTSPMDYVKQGMMKASGFYVVSGVVLVIMSLVTRHSPVAFWRYLLLLSLLATELSLIVGPRCFGLLGVLFPDRVAFQHVLFLHQLFVFLSVALSRVVPVLFPEEPVISAENPNTFVPWLRKLDALESLADAEVLRLLHLELHSMSNTSSSSSRDGPEVNVGSVPVYTPASEVLQILTAEMEDIVHEQLIRAEPPLRVLWDEAVRRRREYVPGDVQSEILESQDFSKNIEGEAGKSGSIIANECSRLPSPAPTLSPELRPNTLSSNDSDEPIRDEGSKTPTRNLPSSQTSPRLDGVDNVLLQTNDITSFIRVVEHRSPE